MNNNGLLLPDIKENVKTYWNERSKTFDDDIGHGADEIESQLWMQYLSGIIGKESKIILDVGTGTGMIAINLAELGHKVTGIDIGEKMIDVGRKKAAEKKLAIIFMQGDAENLPFQDNMYDCVICRHLLWTLPHPDTAIQHWSRVCRPGGLIIAIDGHQKPQEYFPQVDSNDVKSLNERQKLWYQMYSLEVIEQLPLKDVMSVDYLKSFFCNHNLVNVQHLCVDEIAKYQKRLMSEEQQRIEHCEVNFIWGIVNKS